MLVLYWYYFLVLLKRNFNSPINLLARSLIMIVVVIMPGIVCFRLAFWYNDNFKALSFIEFVLSDNFWIHFGMVW